HFVSSRRRSCASFNSNPKVARQRINMFKNRTSSIFPDLLIRLAPEGGGLGKTGCWRPECPSSRWSEGQFYQKIARIRTKSGNLCRFSCSVSQLAFSYPIWENVPPGVKVGAEARPGMADLRPLILKRDEYLCQLCGARITAHAAEVEANTFDN